LLKVANDLKWKVKDNKMFLTPRKYGIFFAVLIKEISPLCPLFTPPQGIYALLNIKIIFFMNISTQ
jgi:hypothetical protein